MNKILIVAIFIIALISCNKSKVSTDLHDAHTHIEDVKLLKSSDKYALYIEFNPLLISKESKLTIHCTDLQNYKPLLQGTLEIKISDGHSSINMKIDTLSKPGIFNAVFTPKNKALYQFQFIISKNNANDTIVFDSIKTYNTEQEVINNSEHSDEGIKFTVEEAWKLDFGVEIVELSNYHNTIKATAKVVYNPKYEYTITSNSSGIVEFNNNSLIVGSDISKNSILFNLNPNTTRDDNFNVRYQQIKSDFSRSEQEYNRISELYSSKIATAQEYLNAKYAYESTKALYDNFSKYTNGKSQAIRANKGGVISQLLVGAGQFVEAGTALTKISNNKKLLLQVSLPIKQYNNLNGINTIKIDNFNNNGNVSQNFLAIKAEQISEPLILNNSSFVKLTFEFDNIYNLLANSNHLVLLESKSSNLNISIPQSSVWEDQGHYFVFVQKNGELYEKREVVIDNFNGDRYTISSGLLLGERIVTKGTYRVMLASRSSALPAHAHTH
ncbi:MAG TPA: efflux RND transporter periplasmic adaptor subunit [Candidatus Kapabacteria bacterium]|nr:efflux RND transporter periplasmic adaptor subunit [Candidatus Kapabacteria bacterium]